MGKRVAITIGGIVFPTKKALYEHVRSIVASYGDDVLMAQPHADFIEALIRERHPWAAEKLDPSRSFAGVRVRHESARGLLEQANRNHLFLVFKDAGEETNFSWAKCCNGFNVADIAYSTMRREVDDQRVEFKRAAFAGGVPLCAVTGVPLTEWVDAHVDHYPTPFAEIVDAFLASEGITAAELPTVNHPGGGQLMGNDEQRMRWRDWHRERASFRMLDKPKNLSLGSHGYRRAAI